MRKKIFEAYIRLLINLLSWSRIARWSEKINRKKMLNRDLVLIDEAVRRGFQVYNLIVRGKTTRFFKLEDNNDRYFNFEVMPLGDSYNRLPQESVDDKWLMKRMLRKANFPTPSGCLIRGIDDALKFTHRYGYPIVIKPTDSSRCQGVTVNICSDRELESAIREARSISRHLLIEKFVVGESYRVMVVDDRVVAVAQRKPPQVVGDGKHSVRELIRIKNRDPRRRKARNSTLHPIVLDKKSHQLFRKKGLVLDSIPQKGELVILSTKINLGSGADTVDLTNKIDKKTIKLSIAVADLFDAKILGLDVITPDISRPPSKMNPVWIIEVNSLPFIDMHHFPYEGKAQNVAGAIWDMVLK